MHCCARNIERLTRIPKLRTDLQSRFVACSCHPLKSTIHELAIWPGPLLAVLSAINNDCAFVQKIVVTLQLGENRAEIENGLEDITKLTMTDVKFHYSSFEASSMAFKASPDILSISPVGRSPPLSSVVFERMFVSCSTSASSITTIF